MKACVFRGPGNLTVEELPTPEPGPGEVLVQTQTASLCFSDIRVYRGEKYADSGVVIGHEAAGVVAKVGEGVNGFSNGDQVALCPILACGECYFCLRGKRNRCVSRTTLGYQVNGCLAEYILAPRDLVSQGHLLKVPPGMPADLAAMVEPFACALYSLEVCHVRPGGSLAIIGAGPMGLTHLLIARAMGCATIVMSDPIEERLAIAQELGATAAVSPRTDDLRETVLELTDGIGADAAIVSVGNVPAIEAGLQAARQQGYVNIFGGVPPESVLSLDPNLIHYNELFLTGTQNAPSEQYARAVHLLATIPQARRLLTHRFTIDEAPKAFESRMAMEGLKAVIDF